MRQAQFVKTGRVQLADDAPVDRLRRRAQQRADQRIVRGEGGCVGSCQVIDFQ